MLKFITPELETRFNEVQRNVGNYQSYVDDVIFPAIKQGNWNELEDLVVIRGVDGEEIKFSDDEWPLYFIKGVDLSQGARTLYFKYLENSRDNSRGLGKKLERNICNQIKCAALCLLLKGKVRNAKSIYDYITKLVRLAQIMLDKGYNDFGNVSTDLLVEWAQEYSEFQQGNFLTAANVLLRHSRDLPYSANFDSLTPKLLAVNSHEGEQFYVVPPRIYTSLLEQYTAEINALVPCLPEIEKAISDMVAFEQRFIDNHFKKIRAGKATISDVLLAGLQRDGDLKRMESLAKKIESAFSEAGIEINDHEKDERWLPLMIEFSPPFRHASGYFKYWVKEPFVIGEQSFTTIGSLKKYLRDIDAKCKCVCLMLSGMRTDELHSICPVKGIQEKTINGQIIYLFCTRQSKVTEGTQTKNDVFVTTKNGHNAYKLLDTIHTPFRKKFKSNNYNNMFASLSETYFPFAIGKSSWTSSLRRFLNSPRNGVDLLLSKEDLGYLNLSDPNQSKYKAACRFSITHHQFRRSFAYYVIGFELMSFPQLKQQLTHLSSAMTRWYANNASSFQKLHNEISVERTRQQSEVFARIHQRLANNERVAGGKGKVLKAIAGDGKNYFEKAEEKRKLSPRYWERLINDDKVHLHAIAPAMYCTNSGCSMRMKIELAECIDCEFDIIENAMYAEGIRMNSMKELLFLDETGELNNNAISMYAMKIRSAEKIMADLDYDFEPFQFPQSVLDAQIGVINI